MSKCFFTSGSEVNLLQRLLHTDIFFLDPEFNGLATTVVDDHENQDIQAWVTVDMPAELEEGLDEFYGDKALEV